MGRLVGVVEAMMLKRDKDNNRGAREGRGGIVVKEAGKPGGGGARLQGRRLLRGLARIGMSRQVSQQVSRQVSQLPPSPMLRSHLEILVRGAKMTSNGEGLQYGLLVLRCARGLVCFKFLSRSPHTTCYADEPEFGTMFVTM